MTANSVMDIPSMFASTEEDGRYALFRLGAAMFKQLRASGRADTGEVGGLPETILARGTLIAGVVDPEPLACVGIFVGTILQNR